MHTYLELRVPALENTIPRRQSEVKTDNKKSSDLMMLWPLTSSSLLHSCKRTNKRNLACSFLILVSFIALSNEELTDCKFNDSLADRFSTSFLETACQRKNKWLTSALEGQGKSYESLLTAKQLAYFKIVRDCRDLDCLSASASIPPATTASPPKTAPTTIPVITATTVSTASSSSSSSSASSSATSSSSTSTSTSSGSTSSATSNGKTAADPKDPTKDKKEHGKDDSKASKDKNDNGKHLGENKSGEKGDGDDKEKHDGRRKRQINQRVAGKAHRKEYRMLSEAERNAFHAALNKLKTTNIDSLSKYDLLTMYHTAAYSPEAHFGAAFLPFHRELLRMIEFALRLEDSSVSLPYWDSTLDEGLPTPADSVLFTDELMGPNSGPITTGRFGSWTVLPNNNFPLTAAGNKIFRDAGKHPSGFLYKPTDITTTLTKTSLQQLTFCIDSFFELVHGGIHLWMGGHMVELEISPNDPIFFLHHTFVDWLWERFRQQKQTRQQRETDYPDDKSACNAFNLRDADMKPFAIKNRDGLSNDYTDRLYDFEEPPTCQAGGGKGTCNSPYLFCDTARSRCLSKVKLGGNCAGLESFDSCFKSACVGGICRPAPATLATPHPTVATTKPAAPLRTISGGIAIPATLPTIIPGPGIVPSVSPTLPRLRKTTTAPVVTRATPSFRAEVSTTFAPPSPTPRRGDTPPAGPSGETTMEATDGPETEIEETEAPFVEVSAEATSVTPDNGDEETTDPPETQDGGGDPADETANEPETLEPPKPTQPAPPTTSSRRPILSDTVWFPVTVLQSTGDGGMVPVPDAVLTTFDAPTKTTLFGKSVSSSVYPFYKGAAFLQARNPLKEPSATTTISAAVATASGNPCRMLCFSGQTAAGPQYKPCEGRPLTLDLDQDKSDVRFVQVESLATLLAWDGPLRLPTRLLFLCNAGSDAKAAKPDGANESPDNSILAEREIHPPATAAPGKKATISPPAVPSSGAKTDSSSSEIQQFEQTCTNRHRCCGIWATGGECERNSDWMKLACRRSCDQCPMIGRFSTATKTCHDVFPTCTEWATSGECTRNPYWMEENCPVSCDVCDRPTSDLGKLCGAQADFSSSECHNFNENCPKWAEEGQCTENPWWMTQNCPVSCGKCI